MTQDHVLLARWLVCATLAYLITAQKGQGWPINIGGSEVRESVLVYGF